MWLGGVAVGCRIRDREVASSIPGRSAARCNSGQVVHTRVPLQHRSYLWLPLYSGLEVTCHFTPLYKLSLLYLLIAADSIVDAINSSRVFFCNPNNELSPNPDPALAGFEFLNPA